jgi:hypothetical protein
MDDYLAFLDDTTIQHGSRWTYGHTVSSGVFVPFEAAAVMLYMLSIAAQSGTVNSRTLNGHRVVETLHDVIALESLHTQDHNTTLFLQTLRNHECFSVQKMNHWQQRILSSYGNYRGVFNKTEALDLRKNHHGLPVLDGELPTGVSPLTLALLEALDFSAFNVLPWDGELNREVKAIVNGLVGIERIWSGNHIRGDLDKNKNPLHSRMVQLRLAQLVREGLIHPVDVLSITGYDPPTVLGQSSVMEQIEDDAHLFVKVFDFELWRTYQKNDSSVDVYELVGMLSDDSTGDMPHSIVGNIVCDWHGSSMHNTHSHAEFIFRHVCSQVGTWRLWGGDDLTTTRFEDYLDVGW